MTILERAIEKGGSLSVTRVDGGFKAEIDTGDGVKHNAIGVTAMGAVGLLNKFYSEKVFDYYMDDHEVN